MSDHASIRTRPAPWAVLLICYAPHIFILGAIAVDWISQSHSTFWALAVLAITAALVVGRNRYLRRVIDVPIQVRTMSKFGWVASAIGAAGVAMYLVVVIATARSP